MGSRQSQARPELVLTPALLRDADQLDKLTGNLLLEDAGLRRLSKKIRRLQERLRKLVNDDAWNAFLKLEEVTSERLGEAIDLVLVFAFEQGRRYQRSVNDDDERKPEE